MTRFAPRKLLTLLLPLALFFAAGLGAAWTWEGVESCMDTASAGCCCATPPGDAPGCDLPENSIPVGPCGSKKSDCGCDNSTPRPEPGLRVLKPGRITDDPDFAPAAAVAEQGASFEADDKAATVTVARVEKSPEHYLRNRSFRC